MARTSWFVGGTLKSSRTIYDFDGDADGPLLPGACASFVDPDEERAPPPLPTPATFPAYQTTKELSEDKLPTVDELQTLFSKVMKPADISDKHLDALNIEICESCAVSDLLPLAADGASYLAPLTPGDAMNAASYAVGSPTDQAESRKRKAFADRVEELQVDNETAYRTLSRNMKSGVNAPRLSYMRKFWQGLESMSRYWEEAADDYYELPATETCSGRDAKRQRRDVELSASRSFADSTDVLPTPTPSPERESQTNPPGDDPATSSPSSTSAAHGSRSATASPEPRSRQRYKGRRTSTGRDMPDQFRADTACSFVESVAACFQCSVSSARVLPVVQFGSLKLPARQTAAVYRMPANRAKARQGRLEGPLLALQARPETEFEDETGPPFEAKARLDVMRELGGLLQVAQERRREGGTEVRPGAGKWWTSKPRWGGGAGYESDIEADAVNIVKATNELIDGIKAQRSGKQTRQKVTPALLWKELKCPSTHWDPKTDYAAIGKDPESSYDEVFMVSSLNHHISIIKFTVHEAYTDSLVSGVLPNSKPANAGWSKPKLQRSQWFDLFNTEQRVEAFRGLWAVIAYLMRDIGVDGKPGEGRA